MSSINAILNNLGLIGDFIKLFFNWFNGLDRLDSIILMVLVFLVFLVLMFNNSVITKKSAYRF